MSNSYKVYASEEYVDQKCQALSLNNVLIKVQWNTGDGNDIIECNTTYDEMLSVLDSGACVCISAHDMSNGTREWYTAIVTIDFYSRFIFQYPNTSRSDYIVMESTGEMYLEGVK